MLLATHLGGVTSELTASPTGTWETHDIALAVVSHSADCDPPPMLPVLLHGGVLVYGLTGPRPNAVADHSHDSLALPITDPDELLSAQRLVIRRLIAATENGQ